MEGRWVILFHCSLISFAQDFFADEPSALVQRLTGVSGYCINGTDTFCLNLDSLQYNTFFSAYSWSCAVAAVIAGWAVDQYGSKTPLWISSAFFVLGSLLFAAGSYASSIPTAFGWMVTGRVLNGIGTGGLVTISHRLKDIWFHNKEIGFAFAVAIVAGRLGSAVNFLLIGGIVDLVGLMGCLWIGFAVTLMAGGSGLYLGWLEDRSHDGGSPKRWGELWRSFRDLDGMFWLFAIAVFLLYGTVSTFTANGGALMASVHGYSEATSSYIVGIVYDICLLAPILGFLLDRYGRRDYWITGSAGTLLLGLLIYLAPTCPGWVISTFVGLAFCIFPPTIWSCLPMIVSPEFLGVSNGLLKFFQYLGIGVMTSIGGAVLDAHSRVDQSRWRDFILYLMTAAVLSLLTTGLINWWNTKTAYRLTPSQAQRRSFMAIEEVMPINQSFGQPVTKSSGTVYGTQTSVLY